MDLGQATAMRRVTPSSSLKFPNKFAELINSLCPIEPLLRVEAIPSNAEFEKYLRDIPFDYDSFKLRLTGSG